MGQAYPEMGFGLPLELALHLLGDSSAERPQRAHKWREEEASAAAGLSGQQVQAASPKDLIHLETLYVVRVCVWDILSSPERLEWTLSLKAVVFPVWHEDWSASMLT